MKKIILIVLIASCCFYPVKAQELGHLWEVASLNNPELKAAFSQFKVAVEQTAQVQLQDPNLSLGYFVQPIETRVGAQVGRLSLSQSFPWFGTLKQQRKGAAFLAEAAHFRFLNTRNHLYFQIAEYYYRIGRLEEWLVLENENKLLLQALKENATARYENDQGALVDILRVQMALDQAVALLEVYQDQKKTLVEELRFLINSPQTLELSPQIPAESLILSDQSLGVEANPLVLALDAQIEAAQLGESVAVKQNLPQFRLGVDYAIIQENLNLPSSGADAWMPTLGLSLPIFKKKNRAAIEASSLATQALRESRLAEINRLSADVKAAQFRLKESQIEMEVLNKLILTAEQSVALLRTAYGNDAQDFEEVLRMHQQIITHKKSLAMQVEQMHVAQEKIQYLLGQFKVSTHAYKTK